MALRIVPGVPSKLPANGWFMETAGIEPALCSHRDAVVWERI